MNPRIGQEILKQTQENKKRYNRKSEAEKTGQDIGNIFSGTGTGRGTMFENLPSPIDSSRDTNEVNNRRRKPKDGRDGMRRVVATKPLKQTKLNAPEQAPRPRSGNGSRYHREPQNRTKRTEGILNKLSAKNSEKEGLLHWQKRNQQANSTQRHGDHRKQSNDASFTINLTESNDSREGRKTRNIEIPGLGGYMGHVQDRTNLRRAKQRGSRPITLEDEGDQHPQNSTGRTGAAPSWLPGSDQPSGQPTGAKAKKQRRDDADRVSSTTRYSLDYEDEDIELNQNHDHAGRGRKKEEDILEYTDSDKDTKPRAKNNRKAAASSGGHTITKTKASPRISTQQGVNSLSGGSVAKKRKANLTLAEDKRDGEDQSDKKKRPFNITKTDNPCILASPRKSKTPGGNPIKPGSTRSQPRATRSQPRETRQGRGGTIEPRSNLQRKAKSKPKKKDEEVIDLLSDDESEARPASKESHGDNQNHSSRTTRATANRFEVDVVNIAIGKELLGGGREKVSVLFYNEELQLLMNNKDSRKKSNETKAKISFKDNAETIEDLCCYIHDDEANKNNDKFQSDCKSFLALNVEKNELNGLKSFRKYWPESGDQTESYIVIEFKKSEDAMELLGRFTKSARQYENTKRLSLDEARDYCEALGHDVEELNRRQRKRRRKGKETDAFVNGRKQDEILLVYPFAGDPKVIEAAAEDLTEARGVVPEPENGNGNDQSDSSDEDEDEDDGEDPGSEGGDGACKVIDEIFAKLKKDAASASDAAAGKFEQRRHFLTVQVRDFERLCEGEFLNDTLIDFWMQWITRDIDPSKKENSIHCFSSHFFTTLMEEGVGSVARWTAKRDINVFEKKFVFIPINENIHWSLCVVVNAGHVKDEKDDDPMACLLFLDSLKAHKKDKISRLVRRWLDSEWKRIHGDEKGMAPFKSDRSFPLLTPKVPYQNNSWDCGVFVCRYAYALLCLREKAFKRNEDWFHKNLSRNTLSFNFNMNDIGRLRREIMTLIENLSNLYLPWKEKQDRIEKEEKKKRRERAEKQRNADAAAGTGEEKAAENVASASPAEGLKVARAPADGDAGKLVREKTSHSPITASEITDDNLRYRSLKHPGAAYPDSHLAPQIIGTASQLEDKATRSRGRCDGAEFNEMTAHPGAKLLQSTARSLKDDDADGVYSEGRSDHGDFFGRHGAAEAERVYCYDDAMPVEIQHDRRHGSSTPRGKLPRVEEMVTSI